MDFFRRERVRCLGKPEWGTGFIVADSCNGKVQVRFQAAGCKLLALNHAKLMKVEPPRPLPPQTWLDGLYPNYFQPLHSGSETHHPRSSAGQWPDGTSHDQGAARPD